MMNVEDGLFIQGLKQRSLGSNGDKVIFIYIACLGKGCRDWRIIFAEHAAVMTSMT